jgi:hypothetical protein
MPKLSKRDKRAKVTITEARRRKELALARIREREADRQAGKLVELDALMLALSRLIINARSQLLGMPSKLAPIVASENDPAQCQELIRHEVYEALEELSKWNPRDDREIAGKFGRTNASTRKKVSSRRASRNACRVTTANGRRRPKADSGSISRKRPSGATVDG